MAIEKRIGAYSAYAIAKENGFDGTVEEWLESLKYDHSDEFTELSGQVRENARAAAESAEIATESVEAAKASESSAASSAQAAAESAQNAQQATEQVAQAVESAVEAVQSTETSAVNAVNGAKNAAITAVNEAGNQAASNVQGAITAAKDQAVSDVQDAGQAVVGKVQEAQTSAEQAVETAQTNAVQSVQAAGADEVKKINGILPVPTAEDAGKVPISKPDGSGYELGEAGVQIDDTKTSPDTTWSSENILLRLCPPFTTEGAIVTCQPVEGSRLNTVVKIEPIQEGEGEPSPENIRPITGWEKVTIWRGGKNLLGEDLPALDGFIDNASNAIVSSTSQGKTYVVPIKKYGTFTVSVNKTQIIRLATCAFKPYVGASLSTITTATSTYRSITTNSSDRYLLVNLPRVDFGTDEPMLVYGDESSYEPYCGKMIEIPFGQTVYGGTLDVTGGIVTKTHENIPSYAGENVGDDWISSTGSLTDGAQVVYRLPQPEIIRLESTEIIAASGINTVYADTGDVTISGYSDPNAIINSLTERIEALEQNVIGG